MKTVIFAGGLGSRISEESHLKPKPMIEIGDKPILWHIMKIYSNYGFNEFIVCLGYKGYIIKEYFMNYFIHNSDVTFDLKENRVDIHHTDAEDFKVTLVETGLNTMTAGRLKRVQSFLEDEEDFMLTYGDGVSDVNIKRLVEFHQSHNKVATVTAIQPAGKFGSLSLTDENEVSGFIEKPADGGTWINGGFFVLKSKIFDYLSGDMDHVMWEQDPMKQLVSRDELIAFKHEGFWKSMDILRDKVELDQMWLEDPKWRVW